jgi:MFS family permease
MVGRNLHPVNRADCPVISGFIVEHAGFRSTFFLFAALAVAGAIIFTVLVPETRPAAQQETRSAGSGAKEFAARSIPDDSFTPYTSLCRQPVARTMLLANPC